MASIYLLSDHGKLTKKNETLQLIATDGTITTLFPYKTERLVFLGNVVITGSALKLLMRHRINSTFLAANGRFNGKLMFEEGKNVQLRMAQYAALNDQEKRLEIATTVVRGKLRNQIAFMQRIRRRGINDRGVEDETTKAKANLEKIQNVSSLNALRGYEGYGARLYYSTIKKNINPVWAKFNGRSMNPPLDNVNAVLSFLYTLVLYRVDAAIESEGLDPFAGFLHSPDYGKRALTFDLMEEYRPSIADTLACSLFNLGILNEEDFETKDFNSGNYEYPLEASIDSSAIENDLSVKGTLLTKGGLRKVIDQFEKKMDSLVFYPPEERQISYKQLFFEQAKQFRRVISGEATEYKPYILK